MITAERVITCRCGSTRSERSEIRTVAGPKVYCATVRPCTLRADRRRRW